MSKVEKWKSGKARYKNKKKRLFLIHYLNKSAIFAPIKIKHRKCSEINEYWNRENEYIKKSGIYTKEEVRQILDEYNRIRREKLAEAKKDYEMALGIVREEKQMAAEDRRMEREELEFERQFANEDIVDDDNNMAYHAYREELAAYADFIASMDMADD